jgi:geranylgeranyl diphosphate synthase type II
MKDCKEFDLKSYLERKKTDVDRALDGYLPSEDTYPVSLSKAMRYSVFSGGKRFRPILCITGFEACGGAGPEVMPVACAIELIHTYSLIHDDLPCMDDDDLRRGKPTNHKIFGEAVAVLAGDALLSFAVQLIVTEGARELGHDRTVHILEDLSKAIGTDGMVAGQVVDMENEGGGADGKTVEYIHSRKTGALVASSVRCGCRAAGAAEELIERISLYGDKVGMAFQIVDDILDVEGGFGNLKAGPGLDGERMKATYPAVFGLERSKAAARRLIADAKDAIESLGDRGQALKSLADFVISRAS